MSKREKGETLDWNDAVLAAIDAFVYQLIEQQVHGQSRSPSVYSWDGELI